MSRRPAPAGGRSRRRRLGQPPGSRGDDRRRDRSAARRPRALRFRLSCATTVSTKMPVARRAPGAPQPSPEPRAAPPRPGPAGDGDRRPPRAAGRSRAPEQPLHGVEQVPPCGGSPCRQAGTRGAAPQVRFATGCRGRGWQRSCPWRWRARWSASICRWHARPRQGCTARVSPCRSPARRAGRRPRPRPARSTGRRSAA
jgi:hypothetical protein